MGLLRDKSLRLTGLFMELVDARLGRWGVEVVTPREEARRGSQVSLRVREDGYAVVQALIERGVIGDFRAPDLMRFGFTPLYVSYTDVWDAVAALEEILTAGSWSEPRFARRGAVT
jgi:kynureninase